MALSDITSVFSRYFVVGFFLPAYVSVVSLWLSASPEFIPNSLEQHSQTTQLLILGGVALIAALGLSGLSYYITRLFEGYPLERLSNWPALGGVYRAAIRVQRRRYDSLLAVRSDPNQSSQARQRAAWCLDRWFPKNPARLLPTRLGNTIRAFEQHPNTRWGLDGVTIWPRIEALLTGDERSLEVDAKINLYVFLNASVGAFVVALCLVVDKAVNHPGPAAGWLVCLIPLAAGYVLYRASLGPAMDWGNAVRSSVDLHRLELYERLGVRSPRSFSDERQLADKVNKALLYGHPLLPDELWRTSDAQGGINGGSE
jgi:hypothetical protein